MLIAGLQAQGQAHPPLPLSLALGASGAGLGRNIFTLDADLGSDTPGTGSSAGP